MTHARLFKGWHQAKTSNRRNGKRRSIDKFATSGEARSKKAIHKCDLQTTLITMSTWGKEKHTSMGSLMRVEREAGLERSEAGHPMTHQTDWEAEFSGQHYVAGYIGNKNPTK